jgi:DNA repair protein RadA/Sms
MFFVNVVGGVKVSETSADLALLLSIVSSLKDKPIDRDTVVFGEVGLAGEIRPVQGGQERLQEAAKHGFKARDCAESECAQRLEWKAWRSLASIK